jgi:hypothetical protein
MAVSMEANVMTTYSPNPRNQAGRLRHFLPKKKPPGGGLVATLNYYGITAWHLICSTSTSRAAMMPVTVKIIVAMIAAMAMVSF